MYIVVIAWLYVVILMAVLESSWIAGVMTFTFYGLLPIAILLYVTGTPRRWKRKKQEAQQSDAAGASDFANQPMRETDGAHSHQNQTDLPD